MSTGLDSANEATGPPAASHYSNEFLTAFLSVHKRLLGYLAVLVPHAADADEVFQRTCLVLWEKWSDFDRSKDLLPWAFGIARIEVRRFFDERGRGWELLGDQASMVVASVVGEPLLDRRLDALQRCLRKLPRDHRSLLQVCYAGSRKLQDIARDMELTPNALSLRLRRIREILHACVDRTLLRDDPA